MIRRLLTGLFLTTAVVFAADVRQFGAVGNGITNDTNAVQAALNACPAGGTVAFPTGTFAVTGLTVKSNCTLSGSTGAGLTLTAGNRFILDISEKSNIHVTGLSFSGNNIGGAILAQGYAPAQNIQIDNCDFKNISASAIFPANLTIVSTWGFVNSTIQNNRFMNVSGGIWLTTVQNVNILNNSFQNVTQGDAIYIAPNPASFPNGDNLHIAGNTGANMARIAIELFRPDPSNGSILTAPVIENNSFSNWTGSNGMGLSITHGDGAIVRGNRMQNSGPIQNVGIEVIVTNGQVTGNVITGNFADGISLVGKSGDTVMNNMISNVTDTGIMFACDAARNRCSSTNSVVSNNTIVEPHFIGIKLDNDWSNSLISRNTIVRSAGSWPDDSMINFSGIHQSPAPGPGVIDSNVVVQASTTKPDGFWFCGVRVNSPMPGSSITNNTIRSHTPFPFGSGLIDNTGFALTGWTVSGNNYLNLWHQIN